MVYYICKIKQRVTTDREKGCIKMKLYYEDILVGEVTTNKSLSVEEALDAIGFNEEEFIEENGFEAIDYNDFNVVSTDTKEFVIYSNDVGAPADKFNEDDDLYTDAQEASTAENTDNAKYAHYYDRFEDAYNIFWFEYKATENA